MAQTVKKGVVAFAATVAMVFGAMSISGWYERSIQNADIGESESVSESFVSSVV